MIVCYVGLGANLDDPVRQVSTAFDELADLPGSRLQARSSLYLTQPVGPEGQPDYVNAVARLATGLDPHALLDALQAIENAHHRRRATRWGPRTLDLDLLLYGEREIDDDRLQVPHPRIAERRFVLEPLVEIAPDLALPDGRRAADLLATCPDLAVARLDPS